ncbi:MAG: aminomethyl-transferring glycine dehydrogenase subunit GcvPA [Deltaproteobacteria bacterium]|nr:aminomethyl-transferring glycine dehydrogenase subunit GcvPA [Deltaproteobacteria bacterium]MBI3294333.1 aminomethyl-transferring glycine dehydrogenase subunit GcvPA [Deltaproteobacteria bacterium]
MPSIPLTSDEKTKVLSTLGLRSTDDLFSSIPPRIREKADIGFESDHGMSEHELRTFFARLASRNTLHQDHFVGGGIYDNTIPAIVGQLALRGEFLTCYTPYQPEISQGTLTAIFEFQTMISRLTAMPVANASMYDGATATAEAVTMALRLTEKRDILMSEALPPDYTKVTNTFLKGHARDPLFIKTTTEGTTDLEHLKQMLQTHDPAAIVIGYPNYFGVIEDLAMIRKLTNALLIVTVPDPSALGLFEAPGTLGADIVCGEAQQFGTPMTFGGPHVGFFATRKENLRQMPGRVAGETVDSRGNRAYTLTLSTREQHIRREKATSNICTNQGLIALRTVIYLSFLGKQGLVELSEINHSLFEYLETALERRNIAKRFTGQHYREGVFEVPDLPARFKRACAAGVIPGIMLGPKFGKGFANSLLIAVNPKHDKTAIDRLVGALA